MLRTRWTCEIHGTECALAIPCFECKREVENPTLIEKDSARQAPKDRQEAQLARERNAKPRLRI